MSDQETMLEHLELAERDTPFCVACGLRTVPSAHDDGTLWLECSSLAEPMGPLGRLLTFAAGHTRREILAA